MSNTEKTIVGVILLVIVVVAIVSFWPKSGKEDRVNTPSPTPIYTPEPCAPNCEAEKG